MLDFIDVARGAPSLFGRLVPKPEGWWHNEY